MLICEACGCQEDLSAACFRFSAENGLVITLGYRWSFPSWSEFAVSYAQAGPLVRDLRPQADFWEAYVRFAGQQVLCEGFEGRDGPAFRFRSRASKKVLTFGYQVAFETWDQFRMAYDRQCSLFASSLDLPPVAAFLESYEHYLRHSGAGQSRDREGSSVPREVDR